MTVPSPPYTTATIVSSLLTTAMAGQPITDISTPGKTNTDVFIDLICGQMDMQFGAAGYVVPLAAISGEDWPAAQTTYLQLVATLGSAAMAGGHSLRPAPALAPGRPGGSGNVLQDMYNAELQKIYNFQNKVTGLAFRANYYAGSPAQIACTEPKGPTTDFLEGQFDPTRYESLHAVVDRLLAIRQSMEDMELSWDYGYDIFDLNKGLGTSVHEL